MKFVKGKFAQKLIIILVVLMVFNFAMPKQTKAWDFGGILLKPVTATVLSIVVPIDTTIGIMLNGLSIFVDGLGGLVELIVDAADAIKEKFDGDGDPGDINDFITALNDYQDGLGDALNKLFIGPDTIFSGKVLILNANIFDTTNITEEYGIDAAFSSLDSFVETASDVVSPRLSHGNNYKRSDCYDI